MPFDHGSLPPLSPILDLQELRRRDHHEADVVVVGAGIFGCAAAITLGRQGRSVLLLEKSLKQPDRIVGELLQPGGVSALEKLDLRDCLENIDAIVVKGYEILYYGDTVLIPYPASGGKRPEGRSFHHGRFIQRLREVAMRTENVTVVESTATELVAAEKGGHILGVRATTDGRPDCFFAPLTIISDGYASKFRKTYVRHTPVSKSKFYGLELHDVNLPAPLHGHVVLGDHAPVLLYQIGSNETRILVDVPENTSTAAVAHGGVKGHLRDVILPDLPHEVQEAFLNALEGESNTASGSKNTLRSMPNSFLPPSTNITPGLLILGDASNMRHPLTGGGMTVAFNDVVLLSELLSPARIPVLADTKAVLAAMKKFHWRRKNLTTTINILAQALYTLFAANDAQLRALQKGCFRYLQLGGVFMDGPVGLLGGIIRQPFVLFYHFFSVALFAMFLYIIEPLSSTEGSEYVSVSSKARHTNGSANGKINGSTNGSTNGNGSLSQPGHKAEDKQAQHLGQGDGRGRGAGRRGMTIQSVLLGLPLVPVRMLGSILVFYKACVVLFPYIFSELRS